MNKIKLGLGLLVITAVASSSLVASAKNDDRDDDDNKGKSKHALEVRALGSKLEVGISDDGKTLVRGAKVTSITSSSFAAATAWGATSLNWTVNTNSNTQFVHRSNGKSALSEIAVGDIVSFSGRLNASSTGLAVNAEAVKNWSMQKQKVSLAGTVSSLNASSSFVLATQNRGNVTVMVSSSTKISKGESAGAFADITVGAKVTASGMWNSATNVLEAQQVRLPEIKQRTTIEGKLKTLPVTASSTTSMVVTVKTTDYTVKIDSNTSILNVLWLRIPLINLRVGDTIRVYGVVNANATVDATVIRDTSL